MNPSEAAKKVVVVGGVALGAGVAAKSRRMSEQAEIVLIERGPYVSFANCGLPYYLGGVIKDRSKLLLHTPESLKSRFDIDVRVKQEVTKIDRDKKVVTVRLVDTGEEYEESYDKLVLAMGARPIFPNLPGKELDGIFNMRTVPDVDRMKTWIEAGSVKDVAVIGAGFIGLEAVENLVHLGLNVTLVEKAPQVLPPFDAEITTPVLKELNRMGVNVIVGDGIASFSGVDRVSGLTLESGKDIKADMVIMGLGVRPDTSIAQEAGLETGFAGALRVNEYLQTSDADIYSGGDLAELPYLVNGEKRWIPLAGAANKQGRIIGKNLFGAKEKFRGAQGTSIVRVGKVTLGLTGFTEKSAKQAGQPYFVSYNTVGHHAGYYPGAEDLTIKLVVDPEDGRLLGAQVVGGTGVDKRIDVLATAIYGNMTVEDLASLDLAYAPPFSSAKDPVIMAGMAAENRQRGEIQTVARVSDVQAENVRVLDVRNANELDGGMIENAVNIPLDQLRDHAEKLDKAAHWVVYCRSGHRSYFATKMLQGLGFQNVYNLTGGYVVQELQESTKTQQPVHS
ncbi:FAD-dependent oxidoreductase [Alicyclobacillus sp. SO9]|uniref:FAD-dependent oxidoreductase n=1 Tax=Alicyclobacillus sp. SO9 TaxID=2665646 RepID=UPI0018E6FBFF|nr:FAD-dependent oxidoreductase [Alicyclobacillus sp. SO9]QQE78079.1 FAD-dependent oxidoreductase [Alicyclobacillus sp. SO9]